MRRAGMRLIAVLVLMIASFAGISTLVARAVARREEARRAAPVGPDVPGAFPVLVVYRGAGGEPQARIVFHPALPGFLRDAPGHAFTVRPGDAARLNAALARQGMPADPRCAAGRFEMRDLGNGRQALKVEGTRDDDRVNVGWYETDGRTIAPRRYVTYFGPGLALMALPMSAGLTLAFWAVAGALLFLIRVRRRV